MYAMPRAVISSCGTNVQSSCAHVWVLNLVPLVHVMVLLLMHMHVDALVCSWC